MSSKRLYTNVPLTEETHEAEDERLTNTQERRKVIEHFDLLLIGKSGHGKSHTGNTILGRPFFKVISSMSSVTKEVEFEVCTYKNYIIKVVDTPGVADTAEMDNPVRASQVVIEQMTDAVILNPEGYHAFLLVVKFGGRFTKEEQDCIRILKHIFGEDFVRNYCILIMTGGDQFYKQNNGISFKKWRNSQKGVFKNLVDECNDRVVLFDNRSQDLHNRDKQFTKLFKCLRKLPNRGERYKDHHFQQADISRKKFIKETRDVFISDYLNEISLILQKISPIPTFDEEKRDKKICKLLTRTGYLIGQLRQDQEVGENKQAVIGLITDIQSSIKLFQNKMNLLVTEQKENVRRMDEEAKSISDTIAKYIETRDYVKKVEESAESQIKKLNEQIDTLKKTCEIQIQKIQLENKERRQAIKEAINTKAKDFDNRIREAQGNPQERMILESQKEACLKDLSNEMTAIDKLNSQKMVEFDQKIYQCKIEKRDLKAKIKAEKEKERAVKNLLARLFGGRDGVEMTHIVLKDIKLRADKEVLEQELQKKVDKNCMMYNSMKEKSIKAVRENVRSCKIM